MSSFTAKPSRVLITRIQNREIADTVFERIVPYLVAISDAAQADDPSKLTAEIECDRFGDMVRSDRAPGRSVKVSEAHFEAMQFAYYAVIRLLEEKMGVPMDDRFFVGHPIVHPDEPEMRLERIRRQKTPAGKMSRSATCAKAPALERA